MRSQRNRSSTEAAAEPASSDFGSDTTGLSSVLDSSCRSSAARIARQTNAVENDSSAPSLNSAVRWESPRVNAQKRSICRTDDRDDYLSRVATYSTILWPTWNQVCRIHCSHRSLQSGMIRMGVAQDRVSGRHCARFGFRCIGVDKLRCSECLSTLSYDCGDLALATQSMSEEERAKRFAAVLHSGAAHSSECGWRRQQCPEEFEYVPQSCKDVLRFLSMNLDSWKQELCFETSSASGPAVRQSKRVTVKLNQECRVRMVCMVSFYFHYYFFEDNRFFEDKKHCGFGGVCFRQLAEVFRSSNESKRKDSVFQRLSMEEKNVLFLCNSGWVLKPLETADCHHSSENNVVLPFVECRYCNRCVSLEHYQYRWTTVSSSAPKSVTNGVLRTTMTSGRKRKRKEMIDTSQRTVSFSAEVSEFDGEGQKSKHRRISEECSRIRGWTSALSGVDSESDRGSDGGSLARKIDDLKLERSVKRDRGMSLFPTAILQRSAQFGRTHSPSVSPPLSSFGAFASASPVFSTALKSGFEWPRSTALLSGYAPSSDDECRSSTVIRKRKRAQMEAGAEEEEEPMAEQPAPKKLSSQSQIRMNRKRKRSEIEETKDAEMADGSDFVPSKRLSTEASGRGFGKKAAKRRRDEMSEECCTSESENESGQLRSKLAVFDCLNEHLEGCPMLTHKPGCDLRGWQQLCLQCFSVSTLPLIVRLMRQSK